MVIAKVREAIEDIRAGRFVIIVDNEDRENEGDLCIAAEKVTPEAINFMAKYGRGLICTPVTGTRLDELKIPMMVKDNTSPHKTGFTVSVEAKYGVTTGISAADRSQTIKTLLDPVTTPDDLVYPGHTFPLRASDGGVLVRAGHTEAIVDLARMAGLDPSGVICEVMNEDGTMARLPQLEELGAKFSIKIISIADLIAYRWRTDKLVQRVSEAKLPTSFGDFRVIAYRSRLSPDEHAALVMGEITDPDEPVLVRVHSECLTGDVFGSLRCDCGDQLQIAIEQIAEIGRGVVLYMRQEGRGIGLHNKIKAYALQDQGMDTVEANLALGFEADLRDYGIGAQILADLGLHQIRLLTNNPKKVIGLDGYGLQVMETVPIVCEPGEHSRRYLETKREKLGHILDWPSSTEAGS